MNKSLHAMTSEQARIVKSNGHHNEYMVAEKLGAIVIKGNGKGDIKIKDKEVGSVKTGKKTQWGLYCLATTINWRWTEQQKSSLVNYFNFLPDSKYDYLNNRQKYKNNSAAIEVYDSFHDRPMDLIKFFCGEGKVDFFHLTDIRDNREYRINSTDFFNKIEKSIVRTYITNGGKFVISGGEKNIILFELEMRKGTNHKKILFHSLLSRIIDVIKN